jgi:cytochrome P450
MYSALRDHDPVHEAVSEEGSYWVLSRFDDIMKAAIDFETFSSAQGLTFTYGDMEATGIEAPIVMMDPPEHTALRKLATKRFTPKQVREIEPMIRSFVVERVERLKETGRGDVVAELFKPLPSLVVAHSLGVPQEDRGNFDRWTDSIVAANASGDVLAAPDAVGELFTYFTGLIEKRRKDPADDMISTLVHADLNGEPVSMAKLLGMAFTMVTGGNDTTTGLLGVAAQLLTENRDQRALLLEDPADDMISTLVHAELNGEPVSMAKLLGMAFTMVTGGNDTTTGLLGPKDRKVMLLYASGNRDEREFGPTAADCDITRKVRRHLTFSYGAHHCIGAALARLQASVALGELLARCPDFSVDADAAQFAGGHFVRRYESLPFTAG